MLKKDELPLEVQHLLDREIVKARIDERKQAKRMSREITKRGLTYLAINYDWWLRRAYKLREELRQAEEKTLDT